MGPMDSTVIFSGASTDNPVTSVCAELFESGLAVKNPCPTQLSPLPVVDNAAEFKPVAAGEYYFIGKDFKFDAPETQKVRVIVTNSFSNQGAADCDQNVPTESGSSSNMK